MMNGKLNNIYSITVLYSGPGLGGVGDTVIQGLGDNFGSWDVLVFITRANHVNDTYMDCIFCRTSLEPYHTFTHFAIDGSSMYFSTMRVWGAPGSKLGFNEVSSNVNWSLKIIQLYGIKFK